MAISKRRAVLEKKHGPINSFIMRGRLGMDNLFLGFAFVGALIIPLYFYFKDKKKKEALTRQRQKIVATVADVDIDDISPNFTSIDLKG